MKLLDPSTPLGTLILGVLAGLISGAIIGFFSGRTYEKKNIIKQKGSNNVIIQDSTIGRD
ncbi:hypothetical protein SAMN04487897_11666 [Paenibacillus sp. yr247]|uniref:hypothetical protein n=1 Tax=Paenibacillus sp. yr247 TaxID=1761880 RepID=UPI00088BA787|nr:hypothetical protein [Paenibacillus sp. yr247]SDO53993.1 hypothetical protein SAMN04487897_11666 [Paenibacillus sp. yr247]